MLLTILLTKLKKWFYWRSDFFYRLEIFNVTSYHAARVIRNKLPESLQSKICHVGFIDTPKSVANWVSCQILDGHDIYDIAIQGVEESLVNRRIISGLDLIQKVHF